MTEVQLYVSLQAFFCGRSDYFKALLEDHFSEGEQLQSQPSTPVITLHNISHEIFIHIMYYIYTDDTEVCAHFFLSVMFASLINHSALFYLGKKGSLKTNIDYKHRQTCVAKLNC